MLKCFSVAVLTAQSVSQCVCRGEVSRQLEWVLLDAHFALLQRLIQQNECQAKTGTEKQSLVTKRCQDLTALIRLTSIAPCQELLDMQEKVRVCLFCKLTIPNNSAIVLGRCTLKYHSWIILCITCYGCECYSLPLCCV